MPPKYSLLDPSLLESLGDDFREYRDKQNKTTPRDSYIGSLTDASKAGAANVFGGIVDFTDANLGIGRDVGNYFNEVAEHNSRRKEYDLGDMIPFASDYYTNPEGLAYTIGQTVGSSAAMLPVIAGVGYAVPSGAAAGAAGLAARGLGRIGAGSLSRTMAGKTGQMIVRGAAGNIVSAIPESAAEGGNVYREMTTGDTPFTDAQGVDAANEVAAKNLPLLMFANAVEAAVIGKALTKPTALKPGDKLLKRVAKGAMPLAGANAAQEGLTEFYQETISGEAKGEERGSLFDPSTWTKEQRMAFGEGAIGGGFLGGTPATARSIFPVKNSNQQKIASKQNGADNTPTQNDVGNITGENILKIGEQQLGKPYELGADGVDATDCGLFTQQTFSKMGIDLGVRTADGQYRNLETQGKTFIDANQLKPGDLVFWDVPGNRERWQPSDDPDAVNSSDSAYKGITHVGIYKGNGKVLQAGSSGVGYMDLNHYPVVGFGRASEEQFANPIEANATGVFDNSMDFATPANYLEHMRDTLDAESDPSGNLADLVGGALETGNEQKIFGVAKRLGYKEKPVSESTDTDTGNNISMQPETPATAAVNPPLAVRPIAKPVVETTAAQQAIQNITNIPEMPKMEKLLNDPKMLQMAERALEGHQDSIKALEKNLAPKERKTLFDKAQEVRQQRNFATIIDEGYKHNPEFKVATTRLVEPIEAELIKQKTGLDVSGYSHQIGAHEVRHAIKKHGGEKELQRGQTPLTREDFLRIPEITRPENIVSVEKGKRGQTLLLYEKAINGHLITVEEILTGRKALSFLSMRKSKRPSVRLNAENIDPVSHVQDAHSLTPSWEKPSAQIVPDKSSPPYTSTSADTAIPPERSLTSSVNNSIPEGEKLFNGDDAKKPGKIFDGERAEKALLERFGKKPQEEAQPEKKKVFNLVDDSDAALAKSIKEVQAELNKLSANPVFNPKLMSAAFEVGAIYLQRGANNFADWSKAMIKALGDKIKPFLNSVWDSIHAYPENVKYDEQMATEVFEYVGNLYENGTTDKEVIRKKFIELAGEEYTGLVDSAYAAVIKYPGFERGENKNVVETTVEHTQGDSQRHNQNPVGQDNAGGQPLAGGGQGVSPANESGVRARGGELLPGRGADTGGESGNRTVRQEVASDKASPAGDTDHRRGGADSANGPHQLNDRPGSRAVEGTTGERPDHAAAKEIKENKPDQQAGHLAKIRESLPNLLPEQHGDVYFAEKRFNSPDGMGVLFTNGTGTGKTFSGLGIAKMFSLEGKDNILIAIPNDKIISDWIKAAAEKFDLNITQLSSTKDNGKSGAVITTYANMGYNNELAKRDWDLIICDESHNLMSGEKATPTLALENLRALTYHDRGLYERFKRLHAKEYADLEALDEKRREAEVKAAATKSPQDIKAAKDLDQEYQKVYNALETKRKSLVEEWESVEKQNKPKVTFLSATPFAYVPTVDYAEGYLFEYNKSKDGGGYNVPDGREDFFMKNFGYRMRYNKLTRPDAEVNTSVMEVNFHSMLRKEGSLSGRMLSIDKDYDRGFLLINDGIGNKVDEGFDWLFDYNKGEFRELCDFIRENYKHHEKLYLLEAIKAKHSVDTINEYLAQGKKVVVFHDYKKGGAQHPFRPQSVPKELREDYDRFAALRPDLINLDLNKLKSPINTFKEAFGDSLLLFNGDVPSSIREKNVQLFNDDNSSKNIILVQSDAGQAGISLHDTTGKHPRVLFNLGMPTKPTAAIQIEGRIYRVGQKSNAMFRYLNTGTNMERFAFANKIAERVSAAENLALGEDARNLKESFISAFENTIGTDVWTDYLPGGKSAGTGGREADRAARERLSDFDRAKAFYYGNMKRNSKTKSAEGIDYYATPEPLGLKMVEWANIREGDKVLEPSAGHGAIARWFPANTENVFVEPSRELGAMAKMAGDGTLISNTFEDYYVGNKFNAIVMNPPFGTGGKTAMEHVAKAFKHLRDGGRIVALVPEGSSMNKRLDAWLESDDAKHAYLVGEISLPAATFERAGTSAKTKILLIDRHMSSEGLDSLVPRQVDLSSAKDINELFDRVKDMQMPERHRPGQGMKTETVAPAVNTVDSAPGTANIGKNPSNDTGLLVTGEHIHTKTGITNYTVTIREKLSDTEYKNVATIAKKHAGYWNKFGKAFFFAEEGSRNKFVNEASPLLAGEKYSISDTEKPAGKPLEEWTSTIKKAFPTAEIIERKGDTFTVNMPNKNVLMVKIGQDIEFSAEDRARAEYALKRPLKPTERPAGTYRHVSDIEGIISLADIADVDTLNHEAYHAARSLALTLTEQQLLDRYFKRNEEAQADGYAKWLKDREAYKGTVIRRFFQKVFDFVNKVKAAFGFENVDNVFRKIAEGEIWNRNVKTESSPGILTFNSLTDAEKSQVAKESREFAKRLDDWKQGKIPQRAIVSVSSTPDILVKLGAKQLPVEISQKTIAKVVNPVEVDGGKHGLSLEQLKKLPEQLYDPVMVFKSATKDNSMVVLTELVDAQGRSIIAAIHLDVTHNHNIVNAISSVYGKDNSGNFVLNQITAGRLLYENTQKSHDWLRTRGLQLPKVATPNHDFNANRASVPGREAPIASGSNSMHDSNNSILPQGKNNVNSPDVTDLKYSIRDATGNLIENLGKFIGSQPAKNVEVKITPNKERLTIPESIFRSPNAVAANHPIFKMFYKMATKASEVQEGLRDNVFGHRLKIINKFVQDAADKATLIEILWRGDMEGKNYSVQELKSEGVNDNVIHAYVRTRSAIEKAYNLLNDARRQVRTHSKNMNTLELSELKNNKFAEIIKISPQKNGECLVTWKSPKTWEKDLIINEQTLELYRQDDAIQILETNEISKTNALGELEKQYQVRVRESIPDIHKRGGYLPHFFHNYFIIGDGEVVGSGKTLADAVKKANKLTEQNPDMQIFIRPKEFKFEGQDVYAAVVGDEEYRRMAEKVAKDSEMTLGEARDYLSDKVKMKPRHRFFGNMMERKGVQGYEQENIDWVLNHYFNSVSRYVALEEFKPQAISLFERYFGRYDGGHTGLAAYAKDYINDINGNPTKLENVLNEALKSSELFRNVLGKYFGDRPALQVASMLTNSMTIAKLGFLNVSSALLNLTQLINAGGILGNPFTIVNGMNRAMNLTATDKKVLLKAGVLNNITFDSSGGYSKLRSLGTLGRGSLWAFKKMDMFARMSTVLAAYHQGVNEKGMAPQEKGKISQEAINYAKEVNRDANFDYGVQDAPNIFRRGSVLAQVALQFQKYPVKEFELMWKLYKKGNIRQNASFWLPYILLAGLFQFPFLELLFDFLKIFDADPKAACKEVVMDWAGKDKDRQMVAEWAMYGIFGPTAGVDISQRAGIADIVPTRMPKTLTEGAVKGIFGPAGSTVYDVIKKSLGEGDLVGTVKAVSPALGNYLQAMLGEATTKRGRTGARYDTWDEFLIRFMGFRSVKEAAISDLGSIVNRGRDEKTKLEQKAIDTFIDDPSPQNLAKLKELKITPQRVQTERQKKKMDNLERLNDGLSKKELPQYKKILDFAAGK